MPLMERTISRTTDAMVVEIDFAIVQLLAVETIASVTDSGSVVSSTATAPCNAYSR